MSDRVVRIGFLYYNIHVCKYQKEKKGDPGTGTPPAGCLFGFDKMSYIPLWPAEGLVEIRGERDAGDALSAQRVSSDIKVQKPPSSPSLVSLSPLICRPSFTIITSRFSP